MKLKFNIDPGRLKKPLLILVGIAVVLGIIAFFAVFYNPGYIAPNDASAGADIGTGTLDLAGAAATTSTTSSSLSSASSSAAETSSAQTAGDTGTTTATANAGTMGASFAPPYPFSWTQNAVTFSVSAVTLQDDALTFSITGAQGAGGACSSPSIRFVADEEGTLQAPATISSAPQSDGTCDTAASFTVNPATFPLLFTTGDGATSSFFEVATATGNGLQIELPGNAG